MCDRVKHAAIFVFIQLHLKCDVMTIFIRCCGGQSVVEFMEMVLFTIKPASVQRVRVICQGLLPKKQSLLGWSYGKGSHKHLAHFILGNTSIG